MKKTILYGIISSSLLLTACGGGSGSDTDNGGVAASYLLRGTVPGTTIEAYCDDGSMHSVESVDNGTTKHPFEIALPKSVPCRVVIITHPAGVAETIDNKVVTPVKFMDTTGKQSIAVTSASGNIDLGNIDVSLSRAGIDDANGDGVKDTPKIIDVTDNDINVIEKGLGNDPMDKDNDGILNIYEDDDGDGRSNRDDNDDDGDGILDINDNDRNNDGINDNDLDGDGIPNGRDDDIDNDGVRNLQDNDIDNDGTPNAQDLDDDNDGINDTNDTDTTHNGNDDNGNHNNDDNGSGHDQGGDNDH